MEWVGLSLTTLSQLSRISTDVQLFAPGKTRESTSGKDLTAGGYGMTGMT